MQEKGESFEELEYIFLSSTPMLDEMRCSLDNPVVTAITTKAKVLHNTVRGVSTERGCLLLKFLKILNTLSSG